MINDIIKHSHVFHLNQGDLTMLAKMILCIKRNIHKRNEFKCRFVLETMEKNETTYYGFFIIDNLKLGLNKNKIGKLIYSENLPTEFKNKNALKKIYRNFVSWQSGLMSHLIIPSRKLTIRIEN